MTAPARTLEIGTELAGRYRLIRRLGRGSGGEVWLAADQLSATSVALKFADAEASTESLRKEWQTGIRLMHAHIARMFEFHDDDNGAFYSMQFVDGPQIGILTGRPLREILGPIGLLADALRYAHGKQLVHSDLKAANVLLDSRGAPYLLDFGVATDTAAAHRGGTIAGSSPQQLEGHPAQPSDDIYALGVLIVELISGRSPYGDPVNAAAIIRGERISLQAQSGEAISDALSDLLERMLHREAARRPVASDIAAELARMGFAAGAASIDIGAQPEVVEEATITRRETSTARPTPATGAAPPATTSRSGIRPAIVGTGLVVLVGLLLAVVFLLPGAVDKEDVVDSEVEPDVPVAADSAADDAGSGAETPFTESVNNLSGRDERVQNRASTDEILGQLLSKLKTLEGRAVQRWGGLPFKRAQTVYAEADTAYLARDYTVASAKYRQAIEILDPLLDQVDGVFRQTFEDGMEALENGDTVMALEKLELAVAISPADARAKAGLTRATNLERVLALTDEGLMLENDLELIAARDRFTEAIELDSEWQPAADGLQRVKATIEQMEFDQRMTEGLGALADGDLASARAAFDVAQKMRPGSPEPADGLLQIKLSERLQRINLLERQVAEQERREQWIEAVASYQSILDIDPNIEFALQGQVRAREMAALYARLDEFIDQPDSLSAPATMQRATNLVVSITRMPEAGPALQQRRDRLTQLLKRAATPLRVQLISDNATNVSIYKVAQLGSFEEHALELRPGTYVAVGSRAGYRDVRLEFRVAPELEMGPVVIRCEEPI